MRSCGYAHVRMRTCTFHYSIFISLFRTKYSVFHNFITLLSYFHNYLKLFLFFILIYDHLLAIACAHAAMHAHVRQCTPTCEHVNFISSLAFHRSVEIYIFIIFIFSIFDYFFYIFWCDLSCTVRARAGMRACACGRAPLR